MEKEINISIPEGYEIDKDKSTFTKIVFKKIENKLPMSFNNTLLGKDFYYIQDGRISKCTMYRIDDIKNNTCAPLYPTEEYAEAFWALSKLIWLRDAWNEGWIPDYEKKKNDRKFIITTCNNKLVYDAFAAYNHVMVFKSEKLRDNFFNQFKDLLEIAKPLL